MPHLGARVWISIVVFTDYFTDFLTNYDSIRCGLQNRGYLGSDQGESGGEAKNAGLKAATLISVSNPVSQVLW
jgi:hypothetical protein